LRCDDAHYTGHAPLSDDFPRVSVVVFTRAYPHTIGETLLSLERQRRFAEIEVILADGTAGGSAEKLRERFPWLRQVRVPGGNMPALKGRAIQAARSEIIAILDATDAAEPGWIGEILAGLSEERVSAVGGVVVFDGPATAANRAAYLFEYGAFNPPIHSGPTEGDLPGNNVAYRRALLVETCGDILSEEGFNKPFFHERIREQGGTLAIRATMSVRHLTNHRFLTFGISRFHYGRCFGATRWRRSSWRRRLFYSLFAMTIPFLLMIRHMARSLRHPANRRLLPHAGLALLGVCAFWGVGEWLGYWFGPGRSCSELY